MEEHRYGLQVIGGDFKKIPTAVGFGCFSLGWYDSYRLRDRFRVIVIMGVIRTVVGFWLVIDINWASVADSRRAR